MSLIFHMLNPFFLFIFLLLISSIDGYAQPSPFMMESEDSVEIVVNNRVLAVVNNKAITVIDIMKKMDMVFYREFPEYTSVRAARFQFYTANWKYFLQDLIDKELVLADAEENKLPLNNGEVRQEMETMFGPNIIANLDKAGLTLDEAWKMVHEDIVIRRMIMYRVNSKAYRQVNPQDVREAYEQYVKDHVRKDEWAYQFISIRDANSAKSSEMAEKIHRMLKAGEITLDQLPFWCEQNTEKESTSVTLSQEFRHKEQEISPNFKEILVSLDAGSFSTPKAQKSRSDNSTVYRIFYLKEHVLDAPASFQEISSKLKDALVQKAIDEETARYIEKLRQHFAVDKEQISALLPEDIQPFALQTQRLR